VTIFKKPSFAVQETRSVFYFWARLDNSIGGDSNVCLIKAESPEFNEIRRTFCLTRYFHETKNINFFSDAFRRRANYFRPKYTGVCALPAAPQLQIKRTF